MATAITRMIEIIVYKGKAYIPVFALSDAGGYIPVEPVTVANLTQDALIYAINYVLSLGHPWTKQPTRDEWGSWKSPVSKAAKPKSRKQLMEQGASYSIIWLEEGVQIYSAHHGEGDSKLALAFPKEVALDTIVAFIMEDLTIYGFLA